MRMRFHSTDFFNPTRSPSSSSFFTLPLPELPLSPPPAPSFPDLLASICRNVDGDAFSIDHSLPTLPIGDALAKFYADVLPQSVDVRIEEIVDCPVGSQTNHAYLVDEGKGMDTEMATGKVEKKMNPAWNNNEPKLDFLLFEVPELDPFVAKSGFCEETMLNFPEGPQLDVKLDLPEVQIPYPLKTQKSVYSIDSIKYDFFLDKETCVSEDDGSGQPQSQSCQWSFPYFEVDETILEVPVTPDIRDELVSVLQSLELENQNQLEQVEAVNMELMASTGAHLVECDLDHCMTLPKLELPDNPDIDEMDLLLQKDFICIKENLSAPESSASSPKDSCGCYYIPLSPVLFQEIQIFDSGTSPYREVFSDHNNIDKPISLDSMVQQSLVFMTFDELVSYELALADDTFRSLPVPILSDDRIITSMQDLVQQALAELKPVPTSVSEEIYLDWHFLEDHKFRNDTSSVREKIMEDFNDLPIDLDLVPCNNEKWVFDMLMSGDSEIEYVDEECKVPLNILSGTGFTSDRHSSGSDPSKKSCSFPVSGSTELLPSKGTSESVLTKSVQQFNDLEFFLNPQKDTSGTSRAFGFNPPTVKDLQNNIPLPSSHFPIKTTVVQNQQRIPTYPEQIIVMNTKNLDKEMVVSRRSTYQRILPLEKEGVQVVERDSNLPTDIVITASVCLIWYHSGSLLKKGIPADEASSSLSFCIDDIAANVLTQLSFAFSRCYLIFEGNDGFISSLMEYSDELYAAAASLGMDLQLLYSVTSELTDDLILDCIRSASRFTKSLLPAMSDSETLAECFLTMFPSINPLSAHAILSSHNTLSEPFQLSHEVRTKALKKFYVPEVGISLFNALCKLGEREDTRSGTTDCSSSMSYSPESDYFRSVASLGCKKRKATDSHQKVAAQVDNVVLQYESSNTFTEGSPTPSKISKRCPTDISIRRNKSTECAKVNSCFDDGLFWPPRGRRTHSGGELCKDNKKKSTDLPEEFVGEVVDFSDNFFLSKDFFPGEFSRKESPVTEKGKASEGRNARIVRRLSFDASSDPHSSLASKFDGFHSENPIKTGDCNSRDAGNVIRVAELNSLSTPLKTDHVFREGEEGFAKSYFAHYCRNSDTPEYRGTPLRTAIESAKLQQGSPWTIEFLNRIREKSQMRQKSFSGKQGNMKQMRKRKSPSILDFYKYQGGSSARKIQESKKQRQEKEYTCPLNRESALASKTPVDKRASKNLLFSTSGIGRQSNLVWTDNRI